MTSENIDVFTYFGDSTTHLEHQVGDLINRGGEVISLAIGYGPSPAKVAHMPGAEDCWHAMVIVDVYNIDPDA